jgi:hypothetical protein
VVCFQRFCCADGRVSCRMGGRSRGRRGVEGKGKGTVVVLLWEGGGEGEVRQSDERERGGDRNAINFIGCGLGPS